MRFFLTLFLAIAVGVISTELVQANSTSSRVVLIDNGTLETFFGAACPEVGCDDKTCKNTGCTQTETFCQAVGSKCRTTTQDNFARCGEPGSKPKYTCSETSEGGCVKILVGDQADVAEGEDKCPTANCKPGGGTCGDTRYTCVSPACGT